MSIREAFYYLREHKKEFSTEELTQQLREKGYQDDEIEEAFLMAQNSEVSGFPLFSKKEAQKAVKGPQTLWEAVRERKAEPPKEPLTSKLESVIDWDKIWQATLFIGGLALAPVFYYIGFVTLLFLQLFFPVPSIDPLFLVAGAVILTSVVGFISGANRYFSRGIWVGVLGLTLWMAVFSLIRYKDLIGLSQFI